MTPAPGDPSRINHGGYFSNRPITAAWVVGQFDDALQWIKEKSQGWLLENK
jgi:hypothetical protein